MFFIIVCEFSLNTFKIYKVIGEKMKKRFSEKLGLRIRELREGFGMKQYELADKLNMERSNLTRIESGIQRPNDENLEKIAEILNVDVMELFNFNHIKTREMLIKEITNSLKKLDEKELSFLYKTVNNIFQLRV